jgi:hypothetical protein
MTSFRKPSFLAAVFGAMTACATAGTTPDTTDNGNNPPLDSGAPKTDASGHGRDGSSANDDAGGGQSGDDAGSDDSGPIDTPDSGPIGSPDTGPPGSCTLSGPGLYGTPVCDQCRQSNCCQQINACLNSAPCAAVYSCTSACFDGILPNDGGTFDAASTTAADQCWNQCHQGSASALALYDTQDNCVTTKCPTQCQ